MPKKQETILMSEFVTLLENGLKETPKVKNYDKIKEMLLPQVREMLKKGDVEIPIEGLIAAALMPEKI